MIHVHFIIGLPGSGKTTWAEAYKRALQALGRRVWIIDDPRALTMVDDVVEALVEVDEIEDPHLFIVDPQLCCESARTFAANYMLRVPASIQMYWHYFANDPVQATINAASRPEKAVNGEIQRLSKIYNPPANAIPVYAS